LTYVYKKRASHLYFAFGGSAIMAFSCRPVALRHRLSTVLPLSTAFQLLNHYLGRPNITPDNAVINSWGVTI